MCVLGALRAVRVNCGMRFVTLNRRQGSRPSLWKMKCKKAKWLSEEALQIAVKRREAKSNRKKERYKHLNAEFQRIARRDKKAFLSEQCEEIEENNRIGKTRSLFNKIRDTKGHFMQRWVHSRVLAWRIPGTGEPGGLPSMGSHRVGHD